MADFWTAYILIGVAFAAVLDYAVTKTKQKRETPQAFFVVITILLWPVALGLAIGGAIHGLKKRP